MRKITYLKTMLVAIVLITLIPIISYSAPFTKGNLVVLRAGDGSAALASSATAAFIDEYTPTGTLVQSIPLPTTIVGSNKRVVVSGTSTSEGMVNLSLDKRYLTACGYDVALATASITSSTSASVNRVVARIDYAGNVDATTALTDFSSASNPRSAITTNGTDIWVTGGATGIAYTTFGSTTSTQLTTTPTNIRVPGIFGNQLYFTTGSGSLRLCSIGSGIPTITGQTSVNLTGFPTATISPYGFVMFDLDSNTPGPDVLYVADDGASSSTTKSITKYCLVSGTWVKTGSTADQTRGLIGVLNGTTVTLYATTSTGTIITLTDNSGYNGTLSATSTVIATSPTNTAFRGIAFTPETPTISVVETSVPAMSAIVGNTDTKTINVSGSYLMGNITTTITGTNAGLFTILPTSLTQTGGAVASTPLVITYAPIAAGNHTATLTLSSTGATDKVFSLSGSSSATGLNTVQSPLNVSVSNGTVSFTSEAGTSIEIYNTVGQKLLQKQAVSGLNTVTVSTKGVLFVKVGNAVAKVIL